MSINNCLKSNSSLAQSLENKDDKAVLDILMKEYQSIQEDLNKFRSDLGENAVKINTLSTPVQAESYILKANDLELAREFINNINKKFTDQVLVEKDNQFIIQAPQELINKYLSAETKPEVNFELKAINILSSDKAKQVFDKGAKNNWALDKILSELQVPKEQVDLIKSLSTSNREEILINLAANYSYTIEINTAKATYNIEPEESEFYTDNGTISQQKGQNTQYYSNLTVPGGTNYTENEIATPAIIPSIKGHAQFSTDSGIGWFRSDDKMKTEVSDVLEWGVHKEGTDSNTDGYFNTKEEAEEFGKINGLNVYPITSITEYAGIIDNKTRRILEVQSDLFQKGRNNDNLFLLKGKQDTLSKTNENNFLQLLNKNNNWVTFFVKSIIQDSAKKGYEKILFPKGDTASKVEGHSTLKEFKKQKENRIKILEEYVLEHKKELQNYEQALVLKKDKYGDYYGYLGNNETPFTNGESEQMIKNSLNALQQHTNIKIIRDEKEIIQLKQELEKVEKEGFAALKPIYKFYEETVGNILNKQFKNQVKKVTDEHGNGWYELTLNSENLNTIMFNQGIEKATVINMVKNGLLHILPNTNKFYFDNKEKAEEKLNKNNVKFTSTAIDITILNKEGNILTHADLLQGESTAVGNSADFLQELKRQVNLDNLELSVFLENQGITSTVKNGEITYKKDGKKVKEYDNLDPFILYYKLKGIGDTLSQVFAQAQKEQEIADNKLIKLFKEESVILKEDTIEQKIEKLMPNVVGVYKNSFKLDPIEALRTIYDQAQSSLSEKNGAIKVVGEEMVQLAEQYFTKSDKVEDQINLTDTVLPEDAALMQSRLRGFNEKNNTHYTLELKESPKGLKPTIHTIDIPGNLVASTLVNQLNDIFPELTVQLISEDDLEQYMPNASVDVRNNTTSFVRGNQVFIIQERITAQTAVEEMLHPFISGIAAQNSELFENLYADAERLYPQLKKQIQDTYADVYSDPEDIRKEFLTQALRNQYLGIFEVNQEKTLWNKFMDWFKDLWEQFKRTGLNVSDIPANAKLNDIVILLKSGVKIKLGNIDTRTFYNLKEKDDVIYQSILNKANIQQQETIEKLLQATPVVFQEEGHTYIDKETGETYLSTTTAIKGPLKDQDAFKINRDVGTQLDIISQAVILGKDLKTILAERNEDGVDVLNHLSDKVVSFFFNSFSKFVSSYHEQGYILLPQLRLGDRSSKIAGSPDFIVIDPEGNIESIIDLKTSKNNIQSSKTETPYSTILTNPYDNSTISLTTKEQHSMQLQGYRELIRLLGFDVQTLSTLHYHVGISEESQQAVFVELDPTANDNGFEDHNGFVLRKKTAEKDSDLFNVLDIFMTNRAKETDYQGEAPSNASNMEDITKATSVVLDSYNSRIKQLKDLTLNKLPADNKGGKYLVEYMKELENIVHEAEYLFNNNEPIKAYEKLLNFNIQKLTATSLIIQNHHKFLDTYKTKEEQTNYMNKLSFFISNSKEDVELAKELTRRMSILKLNESLEDKRRELITVVEDFAIHASFFLSDTFTKFWATNTSRVDISGKDIKDLFESQYDITDTTYYLRDLATSNSKILSLLDRSFKFKMFELDDEKDALMNKMSDLGNRLRAFYKDGDDTVYHYMLKKDAENQITGSYVYEIDRIKYSKLQKQAEEGLKNPNALPGENQYYQYIQDPKNQEEKDFNNNLYKLKQVKNEFSRAEELIRTTDESGWNKVSGSEDGEYHKYSQEFKTERDKHEVLGSEGWIKRSDVDKESYSKYIIKYYTDLTDYFTIAKDNKGELTGMPKPKKGKFVKSEYIEKRMITSKGESMQDPQYIKIMNQANSAEGTLEKAQYDFYQAYIEEYEKGLLSKLPEKDRKKMIGKIGRMEATLLSTANEKYKGNFFAKFIQLLKSPFSWNAEQSAVFTDEHGIEDKKRLPIYFVGDFKNIENIDKLKKRITEINEAFKIGTITATEHTKQFKELDNKLTAEKNLLGREKLETDLVKNIGAFANMALYYHKASEFENTLDQIEQVILSNDFKRRGSVTDSLKRKGDDTKDALVSGKDSLIYKRYNTWKDMVFYRNVNVYQSKGAQVVRKLMQAMSLRSVGLNLFGQINNFLVGEMGNAVERNRFFGGKYIHTYYNRESFNRASLEYVKYASTFKLSPTKRYYRIKESKTKYEAVIKYFDAIRANQTSVETNSKGIKEKASHLGYIMMEKVEFAVQSKTAISLIMSTQVEDKETGKYTNLYDALVFDEKTGKATMPDNFIWDNDAKYGVKNLIWEVNKSIHGNYAFEDKVAIQLTTLGEIASQFKKFLVPAMDARFRNRYENEERGIIEGRYLAYRSLFKYVWQSKGDFVSSIKKLDDIEKMNMIKNLHEVAIISAATLLMLFFKSLGEGLPPDNDKTKKLMNFLSYQNSRLINDILLFVPVVGTSNQYQTIKNPIPVLTYLKDYADIAGAGVKTIMGDGIYQSGVFKGDYKLVKEVKDVLPLINLTNKWENFETIKDFYIK